MNRKSLERNFRKSRKPIRKVSKKSTKKSTKKSLCKKRLSDKIAINMREYKTGRYKSRGQAIAVSYSQVKKMFPRCNKELNLSSSRKKLSKNKEKSRRQARFGFIDSICKDSIKNNEAQDAFNQYLFGSKLNNKKHYDHRDVVNDSYSTIVINGIEFEVDKKIAKGTYGKVLKLTSQEPELARDLAIKLCNEEDETLISEALNDRLLPCDCLRVRSVGTEICLEEAEENQDDEDQDCYDHCYFMELCDGTLDDYLYKIQDIEPRMYNDEEYCAIKILEIIEKLRKQMVCIYETNNDYVYTDLKMANVLYKCRSENDIAFLLGDLGSAVMDEDDCYKSTYPPFEYRHKRGMFKLNTEDKKDKAMAWELGILLLLCNFVCNRHNRRYIDVYPEKLSWIYSKKFTESYFIMLQGILENLYGKDISNLLNTDPKSRRSVFLPLM